MTGDPTRWRWALCGTSPAIFGFVLGVLYVFAGFLTVRQFGWERPVSYALLFDPNSRFSDTTSLVTLFREGGMYDRGFQYPPGAVPLVESLGRLAFDQMGLAQIVAAAIAMGILVGVLMFNDASRIERVAAGGLAAVSTYLITDSHAQFTGALMLVGAATAACAVLQLVLNLPIPRLVLIPAVASSYPLVFSVDRGNLETYAFAAAALSAAVAFGARKSGLAGVIGGVLFGVAVAAKVLPVVLVGAQRGRQRVVVFCGGAFVALAAMSVWGLSLVHRSPGEALSAMAGNNASSPEGYAWSLFYHRGVTQGLVYALVELRGFDGMQAVITPVAGYLPLVGVPVLLAVIAAGFILPGPSWMRYATAASAMVLFANANVVYRASFLSIGLVLWLAAMARPNACQEPVIAALFAAALSPYAFGSVMTPLGFAAPSDTLFGTLAVLALFAYLTWRWTRGGTAVLRQVRRLWRLSRGRRQLVAQSRVGVEASREVRIGDVR